MNIISLCKLFSLTKTLAHRNWHELVFWIRGAAQLVFIMFTLTVERNAEEHFQILFFFLKFQANWNGLLEIFNIYTHLHDVPSVRIELQHGGFLRNHFLNCSTIARVSIWFEHILYRHTRTLNRPYESVWWRVYCVICMQKTSIATILAWDCLLRIEIHEVML